MLENNLHPDVAERPEELVVYGGIGKAARNWESYRTIVRELERASRDDETLLVQSGKPVAIFETHELAPRVLIANSNLVPQWATWEHFRELDAAGLMMYGQMTAGSWIYIGSQGILQGTYETFAAAARKRFGGTLARPARRHRRPRRHGRRAAARRHDARRHRAVRRGRPAADRAADRDRLPRRARRRPRRRARRAWTRARREGRAAVDRARRQRRRGPPRARAPRRRDRRRHRPDQRPRPAQRLRPGRPDGRAGARRCAARTPTSTCAASARACSRTSRAIRALAAARRRGVRLRQRAARARRPRTATRDAFSYPGFVPAYIRPLFCEGKGPFRWVALSGDPADIARHRPRDPRAVRRPGAHRALDRARGRARAASRGCRRGSAGSATASATAPGARFNEMVASGRAARADRDRPRPPRRRLGRLARARDRGDARRLRRGRRLADPERAAEHRVRGELGVGAPRRRRRHGQVDPRRPGRRRRRHAGGRRAASGARCAPTRASASCATPTPATPRRSTPRAAAACTCRCSTRSPPPGERRRVGRRSRGAAAVLRSVRGRAAVPARRRRDERLEPGRPARRGTGGSPRSSATSDAELVDRRERPDASSRASSTATRTCRSPAGARPSTSARSRGVPYEEIARAGRRHRVLGALRCARPRTTAVLAQSRALAARDARARHDDVRVQVRLRALARGRAARAGARRSARRAPQTTTSTALLAHAVPPGLHRRRVDGRGRGDDARGRRAARA